MDNNLNKQSQENDDQSDLPKKTMKQTGKVYQKYNLLWEKDTNYKSWIAASKKGIFYAFCKPCDEHITIKSGTSIDTCKQINI